MCGVHQHSFCVAEAQREIESIDPNTTDDDLCSMTCYNFSKIDGPTAEADRGEQAVLLQKNKVQLKKDARDINVKVNCCINGASCDAPKEVITVTTASLVGCYTRAE